MDEILNFKNCNGYFNKMPVELKKICNLFDKKLLNYLFLKCEHIFEGENKNLDLLFKYTEDYNFASRILQKEGYKLYLSENDEKYKRLYVKFENGMLNAVHLHREISWHNLIVLNKNIIFSRCKNEFPSPEDSLLIHSAHAIFENFKVKQYDRKLLEKYKKIAKDWRYIDFHLSEYGWKKYFYRFIRDFSVPKKMVFHAYLSCLVKEPSQWFSLTSKLIKMLSRKFSLRRKGFLITLIGVNGAGKTTIANELLKVYKPLTDFLHGQKGYYFGWDPFLPTTKFLSKINKKNAHEKNNKNKNNNNNRGENLKYLYLYLEYLARYWVKIYPELRKGKIVITDRYFYDLFAQTKSENKSNKLLLKLLLFFPKPDFLFVLNAPLKTITNRDKNIKIMSQSIKKNNKRIIHSDEYLCLQKNRYLFLKKILDGEYINTSSKIDKNINLIVNKTWRKAI